MSRMWFYTLAVLALWVVDAELRRVYTFYFGGGQFDFLLAALPLMSLVPYLWSLTYGGGWQRLPRLLSYAAWLWVGGFAYALVISLLNGYLIAGSYDFMSFVFPIGIGLWIAADTAPFPLVRQRITQMLFALATLTSVYGIIQYAFPPPWDLAWLKGQIDTGTLSYGYPAPFQIRVFSTFSAHHAFANFLAFVLLLALPELLRKPALLVQVPIWFIAFGLTLYRTGWLVFAVGALIYVALSPRRLKLVVTAGISAVLVTVLLLLLPGATGNSDLATTLSNRFNTLSDLDNDYSRKERSQMYDNGFQMVESAPFGQGLGVVVTTKASDKDQLTAFDSGILGRAVEMGLPGLALYLVALLFLLFASVRLWIQARAERNETLQALAAMAIACNIAFGFEQFSFEANGILMLVVWLLVCLAIRAPSLDARIDLRAALA
jgi:O-antigen ligase